MTIHQPVLLNEILAHIDPHPGIRIIDSTFGGGSHAIALARKGASVLGLDADPEAVREGERRLRDIAGPPPFTFPTGGRITITRSRFSQLEDVAKKLSFFPVEAVLFDLGISSDQLRSLRGFSFQEPNADLDMRLDRENQSTTAADLLNTLTQNELYEIFTTYAQQSGARQLAQAIVQARTNSPFKTVSDLLKITSKIFSGRGRLHPATKVFLALRIAVNNELQELSYGLSQSWKVLATPGKLLVVSFHSGEDRLVKNFYRQISGESGLLIVPSSEELSKNPKSRSAKLRILQKQ